MAFAILPPVSEDPRVNDVSDAALQSEREIWADMKACDKITNFYFNSVKGKAEVVVVDSYPEPGGCNSNTDNKFRAMTAVL